MKKYINKRNIGILIVFLFLLIQSVRFPRTSEPVNPETDFISQTTPNSEISALLKTSCYDCHSNQPSYPWYSNIAPVSWWLQNHIDEGSKHLNFSIWGTYTDKRKDHKLEECIEMVEEGEMPMASYTWMHKEAKLTDGQRLQLVEFFRAQRGLIVLPEQGQ